MSAKRTRLPVLLTAAALSMLIGAGSVFAALPRPAIASALVDYDSDTPALKAADLERALAAGGTSPDRVVVTYAAGFVDAATLARVHELVGGAPLSGDGVVGREVLRVSGSAASAVERLRGLPGVSEGRVERTLTVSGLPTTTDDPYSSYAWGIARVSANQVWGTSTGAGVKVAVLDCGIHGSHPDLAGQVVVAKNFTASATPDDLCNHGTRVAGVIAALTNNGLGVPSMAPGVRLMNAKVLDDRGHGFMTDFENGLRWAADNGARVVNASLAGEFACPASTQAAVTYARSRGVVIVAGAGNSGLGRAAAPASCHGVVGVGAVDQSDARASFSNFGGSVMVAAPGVRIGSTINPDINAGALYALFSGTSMAAPHAAGVAALLWASSYGTSADAVVGQLESTADHIPGTGSLWAYGRINALKAVGAPTPTATPTAVPTQIPPTATPVPTRIPATATAMPVKAPVTPMAAPTRALAAAAGLKTPIPVLKPAEAPTGVRASPVGNGAVQISWQAAVDSRTTFTVYRGDASGLNMRVLAVRIDSTQQTFVDQRAPLGGAVTYSVAAQNPAGEGPRSAPVGNVATIR